MHTRTPIHRASFNFYLTPASQKSEAKTNTSAIELVLKSWIVTNTTPGHGCMTMRIMLEQMRGTLMSIILVLLEVMEDVVERKEENQPNSGDLHFHLPMPSTLATTFTIFGEFQLGLEC
jgi:hypothetical protein